jgi:D-arabinose 5-phosphate isomerase GutQ
MKISTMQHRPSLQRSINSNGIGKRHNSTKMVATLTPQVHRQCLHAAEAIHGDLGMMQKDDIIICISKAVIVLR